MRPGEPTGSTDRRGSPPNRTTMLATSHTVVNGPTFPESGSLAPHSREVHPRRAGQLLPSPYNAPRRNSRNSSRSLVSPRKVSTVSPSPSRTA